MIVKQGEATPKTADSADSVFVGHLVTNQPLTEAKCSSCPSYCAGHSRTRVTLWSPWASGPQHTQSGWERRWLIREEMLSSPEEGSRERFVSKVPPVLQAQRLVFRGEGVQGREIRALSPQLSLGGCLVLMLTLGVGFSLAAIELILYSTPMYILGLVRERYLGHGAHDRKCTMRLYRPYPVLSAGL